MGFIGEKCVSCGEVFTQDDDIVVCPECGSPHHRSCYKALGRCANAEHHSDSFQWEAVPAAEPEEKPENTAKEELVCPYCGNENAPGEIFCSHCGNRLEKPGSTFREWDGSDTESILSDPYLGFDPNEDMGGASLKEITEFIGPNKLFYLPLFKRMKDLGAKASFNLICFVVPPFYFANRRMWLWAILSTLFMVILGMPAALYFLINDGMTSGYQVFPAEITEFFLAHKGAVGVLLNVFNIADLIMRTVFCIFGNWMYFRFALRSIKGLRSVNAATSANVAAIGGTRPLNMLIITLIFGAIALIALYGMVIGIQFVYLMISGPTV